MKWITLAIICSLALLSTQISAQNQTTALDVGSMQSPWLVYIQPYNSTVTCGGVLISSSWVLSTVSKCTQSSTEFLITSGASIIPEKYPTMGSDLVTANSSIVYAKYTAVYEQENNIVLIKLLNHVSETDFVKYIRLPKQSHKHSHGTTAITSTWGIVEAGKCCPKVTHTKMVLVRNSNCKKTFSRPGLKKNVLCAQGNLAETYDHSHVGGSLVINENDGIPSLIGLLSFHHKNLTKYNNVSVGYVRMTKFLDWVQQKTGIPVRQ